MYSSDQMLFYQVFKMQISVSFKTAPNIQCHCCLCGGGNVTDKNVPFCTKSEAKQNSIAWYVRECLLNFQDLPDIHTHWLYDLQVILKAVLLRFTVYGGYRTKPEAGADLLQLIAGSGICQPGTQKGIGEEALSFPGPRQGPPQSGCL